MTPISTGPAWIIRTPPSAISPSLQTIISAISCVSFLRIGTLRRCPCFVRPLSTAFQFWYLEIFPAGNIGDFGKRLAEWPRGVDADGGSGAHGPRPRRVLDRRIGRAGGNVPDNDDILVRLHTERHRPFHLR